MLYMLPIPAESAGSFGRRPPRGLAIGLILLAILLLAAIAIAIAWGARQKSGGADEAKMLATSILNEGATLKRGYDGLTVQGVPITSIAFDTTADTGLFNPTNGIPAQILPAQALVRSATWIQLWDTNGSWHSVEGAGTSFTQDPSNNWYPTPQAPYNDYLAVLPYVSRNVCAAINTLITGSSHIPQLVDSVGQWTAIDGSGGNRWAWDHDNWLWPFPGQICVVTTDNYYVFIQVVQEQ